MLYSFLDQDTDGCSQRIHNNVGQRIIRHLITVLFEQLCQVPQVIVQLCGGTEHTLVRHTALLTDQVVETVRVAEQARVVRSLET